MIALWLAAGVLAAQEAVTETRPPHGAYLPPLYNERAEEKRRKRIKDREKRLDEIVDKAWRSARGILEPETVAAIFEPVAEAKATPARALEIASRLVDLQSDYPDMTALDAVIARMQREAVAIEQMIAEAAAYAAQVEEEAIILLLS